MLVLSTPAAAYKFCSYLVLTLDGNIGCTQLHTVWNVAADM